LPNRRKGGIADTVLELAAPYAEKLGLTVWDVRYVKEGGGRFLRIFIDRPGGVGIEDCEKMSRAVSGPLDQLDPIPESYCLEVSSPGVNRELTRAEHFQAYGGSAVTVRMIRPLPDGRRDLRGTLAGYSGSGITLDCGSGNTVDLSRKDIASVRLREDDFLEENEKP
jgi:ribosome maturation factor RimP